MSATLLFAVAIAASVAEVAPDEGFSEEVRSALGSKPVDIAKDGATWMTIWPVASAPASNGEIPPGSNFGSLDPGTLVGALRLAAAWTDYKGNPVAPGVYTLRAWLLPEDGNHMGVAMWRDFLLLSPAAEDRSAAASGEEALFAASNKAAGKPHPAVLALFPVPEGKGVGEVFENDVGQRTVVVEVGGVRAGLVVVGEGEH
jgi:hypothetical protein